jgi:uncharacterized protein (TIGR03437 family)
VISLLILFQLAPGCSTDLTAPCYTAATVVNPATNQPLLAPGGMAAIYGAFLSFSTRALGPGDLSAGMLPIRLPGAEVTVLVDGYAAPIWYVSPAQINFQVPSHLRSGQEVRLIVARDGKAGPPVLVRLASESPGFYAADPETVIAVRLDGSLITPQRPARRGEMVVLFANALGQTDPDTPYRMVPVAAAPLRRMAEFRILMNGVALAPERTPYAGTAPGFAGLYQINLLIPEDAPETPELQIRIGDAVSPRGPRLPLR